MYFPGHRNLAANRRHGVIVVSFFSELLSTVFEKKYLNLGKNAKAGQPITELAEELVKRSGEASSLALASAILSGYNKFDDSEKLEFFNFLTKQMDIDAGDVHLQVDAYAQNPSRDSYATFLKAAEPLRQELFRRLNHVPGATAFLVRMRSDLLRLGRGDPQLEALDLDMRHLFASWFNRGFLVLRRISWESPALILEKIIAYEAVHAIGSWDDLRRRMEPEDRRCFAFFHPAMPDEPLIFVQVALTKDIASSVQDVLAEEREGLATHEAKTAVFYSISNCQAGLAGISFGNSLIKQVVADLSAEVDTLKTFVTLSPIPKLATWAENENLSLDAKNPDTVRALAAYYLINAKGRGDAPYDPVARFHLGNGASIHAIHADADVSDKGRAQSAGVMVNYLYDLKTVEENQELFAEDKTIKASNDVLSLAKEFDAEAAGRDAQIVGE
jgi:malonyl-CoA decarboxylase